MFHFFSVSDYKERVCSDVKWHRFDIQITIHFKSCFETVHSIGIHSHKV